MSFVQLLFTLIGGIAAFAIPAPSAQDESLGWGIGVLLPITESETRPLGISFPAESVPVFDLPNGKDLGLLKIKNSEGNNTLWFEGKVAEFSLPEMASIEYEYEARAVLVYETAGDWAAIMLENNDNRPSKGWIHLDSLEKLSFRYWSWREFLLNTPHTYHVLPENGLNLREGPSKNHPVIQKLSHDQHQIMLTGNSKGLWFEVRAELWPVHPCFGGEKATQTYLGWIKALDDKGYPNIWFPTRGC
jgi:hypothetical protein